MLGKTLILGLISAVEVVVKEEAPIKEEASAIEEASSQPEAKTRWLDQYLKKNAGEESADQEAALKAEAHEAADVRTGASSKATNSYVVSEGRPEEDAEIDGMVEDMLEDMVVDNGLDDMPADAQEETASDPRTFRIEDGKLVEVTSERGEGDKTDIAKAEAAEDKPDATGHSKHAKMAKDGNADKSKKGPYKYSNDVTDMANDSTPLLSTVMREAAAIKMPELRDQAYFEITEYALSEGRFDSARMAHDKIAQEELAYTAKSRIAVAFAQNGKPTKAFKVIGEVDEPELRDFMRLQVIEALIAPERLPETWQPKGAWQEKQN